MALSILILSQGVSIARVKYRDKSKQKRDHSKKLCDKELKIIANTSIGSSNDYSLNLCIEGRPSGVQTYDVYSDPVAAHLEKGYPELWKHKIECDSIINSHNKSAKLLLDTTKEKILKEIENRNLPLKKGDYGEQSAINYFIPRYLFKDICYVIQNSYIPSFDIEQNYTIHETSVDSKIKWNLSINSRFAVSSNKTDVEELKQIIKETLNVVLTTDDFSKLKIYKNNAEVEHDSFLKGIKGIIQDIDNDIPLKGKCEICKKY
ncbi:MAG: hypothetical protein AEth_01144 [Candidatus Argoarchaeum ethanivorans]|uniref:Uncharacterized protein n=1 Tax=Candidatus Argoarchaeum ethanivorans TaxID=2608793 RepID=A0A8B3S190_9EURY|nr:MAG: hypothetical protein AEth_01144 [Candidatus Argoarchaeum ethanivorans]